MIEKFYSVPGAPSIALIGDFHNGEVEPVFESLCAHRPSLICLAGDTMYAKAPEEGLVVDDQKNVMPLLRECVSIAPTFMSVGNHESILYSEDWEKIKETGVVVLDNEWKRHGEIAVGGLTSHYALDSRAYRAAHPSPDPYHRHSRIQEKMQEKWTPIDKPDLSWLTPLPSGYTILLSHHPEYFPQLPGINLVLSAHAHGGQWRYYSLRSRRMEGLFAPNQGWFPKYTKGIYTHPTIPSSRMVVTAGLTNTADVPRLFNPTEIVYINTEE